MAHAPRSRIIIANTKITHRNTFIYLLLPPTNLFSQTIDAGGAHSLNFRVLSRILEAISFELCEISFFVLFKSPRV